MATSFSVFRPTPIISSAFSNPRKPDPTRSSSNSWWTPLFGWSSDPDYIHNPTDRSESPESEKAKQAKSRFSPGCFTEEKAKQLRMKTMETATFHDIMYHSAIASRLASDVSGRNDR